MFRDSRRRIRFAGRLAALGLLAMTCLYQGACTEVGSGGISLIPNYLPAPLPILIGSLLQ